VRRYKEINDFERMLAHNGTTVIKIFLLISRDEQRRRLQARLDDPQKQWKFNPADLAERKLWDRYSKAFADAFSATATKHAPWYVIPANHKWYRNYLVAKVVAATLKNMHPQFPAAPRATRIRIT
jgi:polyphosphate kinase 2 (PPK2 family)